MNNLGEKIEKAEYERICFGVNRRTRTYITLGLAFGLISLTLFFKGL